MRSLVSLSSLRVTSPIRIDPLRRRGFHPPADIFQLLLLLTGCQIHYLLPSYGSRLSCEAAHTGSQAGEVRHWRRLGAVSCRRGHRWQHRRRGRRERWRHRRGGPGRVAGDVRDGRRRGGRLGGRRDPSGSCNTEVSWSDGAPANIHNSSARDFQRNETYQKMRCVYCL